MFYFVTDLMQDHINIWVSKTTNFLNELTSPQDKNPPIDNSYETDDVEEVFMTEHTIDSRTPSGDLSIVAIISIEQFSRMNGLTGKKMQTTFKELVRESVSSNARNLVEYCCFKFLCRDTSEIHPSLKEAAFQRLIFATMLAWEHPYRNSKDDKVPFQRKLVGEEAFVRIAPSVCGVADWPTAHNLFKALSGAQKGISFRVWSTYVNELLKVYERRKSYLLEEIPDIGDERILCLGSGSKRPVLKWENNMAWPGKLTLTDKALYFEEIGLRGKRDAIRMDLTCHGCRVEKAKVGPFGSNLFDSAVSITSGSKSKSWILEFVDFGGEMRRDVWHAFIKEVISVHQFVQDFGPKEKDQALHNVYGAKKGKTRATDYAINGIARLQALQIIKKLLDEPTKLVQFSYLQNAPYGEIVLQTLAVNLWGGQLTTRLTDSNKPGQGMMSPGEVSEVYSNHVYDIDGSVYLRRWMKHPSWNSSVSIAFWKNASVKQAIVLSKSHVVDDRNLVEKAMITCRDKYQVVESTQATIDAAMIEGIPSNIDLFKELLLPLTMAAKSFEKLRRWEEPYLTASFLAFSYTLIFRNLLCYVFPTSLMVLASCMLVVKGLKEQGRLGRYFGKVTICDQPPSNTIEKIIAVKEAMSDVEKFMQTLNVSLLKIRTILLAGQPKITTEVAVVLFFGSATLLIIPFKYILAFFTFDLFTRELEFRKETVRRFNRLLKERWDTVPATPVSVLPFMSKNAAADHAMDDEKKERNNLLSSEKSRKKQ
ncbi:uncharacterized protein LOC111878302 isoform X2 [Lactuca sativa]|uniref:uncharacterized protein LOC111878302 isoform X2 n=1 Tax=Lactuca sativa TaxID=4236 RepID=UPI000CD96956|nr:uncharacterized protein LOC111878302 isoform X2 [Lactuca sativa]